MSISFPTSPTDGQIYQNWVWNAANGSWDAVSPGLTLQMRRQIFTGSGTYTPSPGMFQADIECVGGGGGGGLGNAAGAAAYYTGGGGGAGGYSRTLASKAQIGASQVVTIGAAGAGSVSVAPGGTGGVTSVGTLCVANGGLGGSPSDISHGPYPGLGGAAGTGDIAIPGQAGIGGLNAQTGAASAIGSGGNTIYGAGGAAAYAAAGVAGRGYGAGGSGGSSSSSQSSQAGGAGTGGIAVITEYCWMSQALVAATTAPGARVLLMSQSVVTATPVAFVNMFYNFTNTYDLYEIDLYDLQGATANQYITMRLSFDGSTFDATASAYAYAYHWAASNNTGGYIGGAAGLFQLNQGQDSVASVLATTRLTLPMPWVTDRNKYIMFSSVSQGTTAIYQMNGIGEHPNLASIKGLQFAMGSGNITRGVFNLYGIVKSGGGT